MIRVDAKGSLLGQQNPNALVDNVQTRSPLSVVNTATVFSRRLLEELI